MSRISSVTIYDVAERAAVSPSTVSRVMSGRIPVAEDTKQIVLKVAAEMGYRPNAVARSLSRRSSDTVGIVIPDITNPFFPSLVSAFEENLAKTGLNVILANTNEDPEVESRILDLLVSKQVRYVVVAGLRLSTQQLKDYADSGMVFVSLDRAISNTNQGYLINSDNFHGAQLATKHLWEMGHRHIVHLAGPGNIDVSRDREAGYRLTLDELSGGQIAPAIYRGEFSEEAGTALAHRALTERPETTAILAGNDLIAIGAMHAAEQSGRAVPHDLSMVGFDDIPLVSYIRPNLTTVRQDVVKMAEYAARIVSGQFVPAERKVTLPVTLEKRDSVAPITAVS